MTTNEFFTSVYSWFCDQTMPVFKALGNCFIDDELVLSSSFPAIGFTTLIVSFVVAFAFYIWPINHPRFKAWWSWLIMLGVNAAINFGLAFAYVHHRLADINKDEEVIEYFTGDDKLSLPFSQWMDFALANLCVSIMFFILASLILTWFSTNCRLSPFRS